jgi:uncharacterized protein YlxW (UPF0749 family)
MPYTEEYIHNLRLQRRIFLFINCVSAVAMGILFWAVVHQQHQITRANHAIQEQRHESIIRDCQDQNVRHDNTIKTLNKLIANLPRDERARAETNKAFTVVLINALAPKQNCNSIADVATGGTLP